ncbi:hypothetical protein [Streptomyces sp. NPDC005485]|uniref:hypothetical protein n=1 Tax=Streptomyces sp. NPDC005485 TaxID=3155591 RepID=UPI0033A9E0D8
MTTRGTTKRRTPAKTTASVQPSPQQLIDEAEHRAKDLVAEAEEQAAALLAATRQDADQVLTNATTQASATQRDAAAELALLQGELKETAERRDLAARELQSTAQRTEAMREEVEDFVTRRRAFVDQLHREAIETAARIRSTADQDAQALRETAHTGARTVRDQADAEATRIREAADRIANEARQLREQVGAEAGRVVAEARRQAKLIRYDADVLHHRAERDFEAARQAQQVQRGRYRARLAAWAWTKAPWAALCAAVGLTASGEYELAHMVGWPGAVAALLPVTIDVWAVTAFHRSRDVKAALAVMIGTNAVYHLAERGMFGVDHGGRPAWWLIILTASIAPIVVWRVHQLIGNGPESTPGAHVAQRPTGDTEDGPTGHTAEGPTRLHAVPPSGSPTTLPPAAPSGSPTPRKTGSPARRTAQRTEAKSTGRATDEELIAAAQKRAADGSEPSATWLMNTYGVGAARAGRIRDAAKAATAGGES